MGYEEQLVLKALIVLIVFITVFSVVAGTARDLAAGAYVLGVIAALGAVAALSGGLRMIVQWSR